MRWLGALLALFAPSVHGAASAWPPLPKSGFVSGRLATEADLKRGEPIEALVVNRAARPDGRQPTVRRIDVSTVVPRETAEALNVFLMEVRQGQQSHT